MKDKTVLMDWNHQRWDEFLARLEGPEGCNFHEETPGNASSIRWTCSGGYDKTLATKILHDMNTSGAGIDIAASLEFFNQHGGHCDCEILFNVAR